MNSKKRIVAITSTMLPIFFSFIIISFPIQSFCSVAFLLAVHQRHQCPCQPPPPLPITLAVMSHVESFARVFARVVGHVQCYKPVIDKLFTCAAKFTLTNAITFSRRFDNPVMCTFLVFIVCFRHGEPRIQVLASLACISPNPQDYHMSVSGQSPNGHHRVFLFSCQQGWAIILKNISELDWDITFFKCLPQSHIYPRIKIWLSRRMIYLKFLSSCGIRPIYQFREEMVIRKETPI